MEKGNYRESWGLVHTGKKERRREREGRREEEGKRQWESGEGGQRSMGEELGAFSHFHLYLIFTPKEGDMDCMI